MPMDKLQNLLISAITLLPEGGQRTARRNAWAAMSENARRARDRREAATAVAAMRANPLRGEVPTVSAGRQSN